MDFEIVNLLKAGKKLEAIKKSQEIGGLSFQEAKLYIEDLLIRNSINKVKEQNSSEEDLLQEQLLSLLASGKKLDAIKKVQDFKGFSFDDAKKFIDGLADKVKPDSLIYSSQPFSIYTNTFKCDVCGKEFSKSLVTTLDTKFGIKQVCSINCQTKAKEVFQEIKAVKSVIPTWVKAFISVFILVVLIYFLSGKIFEYFGLSILDYTSKEVYSGDYQYKTTVWADTPLFEESQISEDDDLSNPKFEDAILIIKEGSQLYVINDVDSDEIEKSYETLYAKVYFEGTIGFVNKYWLETHFNDLVNESQEEHQNRQIEIKGEVKSSDGSVMPGVDIFIEDNGSDSGTVSDINGRFSILVTNNSTSYLIFSFYNYKRKMIKISDIISETSEDENMEISVTMELEGIEEYFYDAEVSEDEENN